MITLYRRGKVFWAQSTFGGTQRRWSLHTRDRHVAEALRRRAELEHLSGGQLTPKRWADFQQGFLQWIAPQVAPNTYKEYARVLKLFSDFVDSRGIAEVRDLDAGAISAFTHLRSRATHRVNHRPMSPGGQKFELRILHRVFAYAIEQGFVSRNPVTARNLNAESGKTLPFTPEELRQMLAPSPYLENKPYLKAVVLLFLYTGLRISDVIHLQRSSIAGGILHRKTKKRGTTVRFPLHPDVLAALAQVKPHRGSPYVFTTDNGRPIISLDKHLRRFWKRCGIVGGHAHRFRDTFAVNLLAQGASLYDVAKLLGISHQTAERHYSPYVKELQERGARLIHTLSFSAPA